MGENSTESNAPGTRRTFPKKRGNEEIKKLKLGLQVSTGTIGSSRRGGYAAKESVHTFL